MLITGELDQKGSGWHHPAVTNVQPNPAETPALDPRFTGPEAIEAALKSLNLDELENEQREVIRLRKKTARPRAVRLLNVIQGMRKNQIEPKDLMIRQVPVIPPGFRPFSVTGDTFIPGDSNELYRDLMEYRRLYQDHEKTFGRGAASEVYGDLNKAVKAVYGYDESPNPKVRARAVKGFFTMVTGTSPKTSFYQSKMLAKPVDTVGRGVIIPDADLDMDEVGVPEEMAWKLYANYIQRRLVTGGMSPAGALQQVKDRSQQARKALEDELTRRPVVITRSPAWHKFNVVGQRPKLVGGDAIRINTFITEGQNADFDGDTMSVHVPSSPEAVKDVQERLMASNMLWSNKDRTKTMANPKHEQIIGLSMGQSPGGQKRRFTTNEEAMDAIKAGQIDLNDDIEIG
jgi:DNA-directed RNA polymerase subunit beta'